MSTGTLTPSTAPEAVRQESQSYWSLVGKRFRRNRMAMLGSCLLALLFIVVVFGDFLAASDPTERNRQYLYQPPQSLSFVHEGEFSFRPFIYPSVETFDPVTFEISYEPDTSNPVYLEFFVRSWDYKFLGLFESDLHLFGLENGEPIFLLGSDGMGRDMLGRIFIGTRLTLLMALLVVAATMTIGTLLGIVSGYFGGRTDTIMQRVVELVMSFPDLPIYLALIAVLPKNTDSSTLFILMIVVMSSLKWAQLCREIRGKTLALRNMDYVRSAEAVGAGNWRIIYRHILPNVFSHVVVVATISIPGIILMESFLSFLGVGIKPPLVSWGLLLNNVRDFQAIGSYPWLLSPVAFILIAVLGFNAMGDGLRDAMDPYAN